MRLTAICCSVVLLASAAMAQLTPGVIVKSGEPFPIVADFNGDGLDDLIQDRAVILNDGTSFTDVRDLGLPAEVKVWAVLDVNGDHIPDLLTDEVYRSWTPLQPPYRLYIGNASGTYANGIEVWRGTPPYVADVDGDGRDDLVTFHPYRPDTFRTLYTEVTVLRSRGDGTFERLAPVRIPADPQTYPDSRLLTADVNHDGLPDIVIRCTQDLVVLRGIGGGRFAPESRFMPMDVMNYGWWSTRLADIDGDGNVDVVIEGWRRLRVFFGDGHGNFPRMTTASIPRLHDIDFPPIVALVWPGDKWDKVNQPRDLAIGHFTRGDRNQIAAGTSEGDIVVFSYEDGALKEVARTATEFWGVDLRAGKFHRNGGDDIYAMGTLIWGEMYPRPRIFNSPSPLAAAGAPVRTSAFHRALRSAPPESALDMEIRGDCIPTSVGQWVFARNGVFGTAQRGEAVMEALFDPPSIYYRLNAPWLTYTAAGTLQETDGAYSGTTTVFISACGNTTMTITATDAAKAKAKEWRP